MSLHMENYRVRVWSELSLLLAVLLSLFTFSPQWEYNMAHELHRDCCLVVKKMMIQLVQHQKWRLQTNKQT